MTKIRPNIKADADRVRKYSVMLDKHWPAMDGGVRRRWAENDAMADILFGFEDYEPVKALDEKTLAVNGMISDRTYDQLASTLKDGDYDTVRINSAGGVAAAGVAIYHLLADKGVRIEVEGMAFSAASVIASAGDPLVIKRGATFGIHRPWSLAIGNYDDLREEAEFMEVMSDAMFEVYSARVKSKKKLKEVKDLYMKDSLLNGKEAVRLGLADEAEGDGKEDGAKAAKLEMVVDSVESPEKEDAPAAGDPTETWNEFRLNAKFGLAGK